MRLIPRLLFVVIAIFISSLVSGKILHPREIWQHPEGLAVYVRGETCSITADVKPETFVELLEWCRKSHEEDK